MPQFPYSAVDSSGHPQQGTVEASTSEDARQKLLRRGYSAIHIGGRGSSGTASGGDPSSAVAGAIATATASGLPLASGLRALAAEAGSAPVRASLLDLSGRIEAGMPLETALAESQDRLPSPLIGVMRAGIRSGQLPVALARYVDLTRDAQEMRRSLLLSLLYPALLLLFSAAVLTVLAVGLMPSFEDMFTDFSIELPSATRYVLTVGTILPRYWAWTALGLVALLAAIYCISRAAIEPEVRSQMLDLVPVIGPARRDFALARFCRMLSLLVSGQTPMPEALRLAGATANSGVAAWSERLARDVEAGASPADAARRMSALPQWITPVLRWHDRGPAFAEALDATADLCVARSQSQLTLVTLVAEPAVIVFVAIMVGLTVLTLFLPLVRLLNELS